MSQKPTITNNNVLIKDPESIKNFNHNGEKLVSRKTFVIDTNVLLHDPDAIERFINNDVVIPLAVLEELDGMKRLSDELGKNARQVIRYIDGLKKNNKGDLHGGVDIGKGISVKILVDVHPSDKGNFPLPLDRNTNKILLVAYKLKETGKNVVLVSKDFVMRVKAEAIGLEAEDYANLKVSYDHIYKGYRTIEVPKKDIDLFYKDGFLPMPASDLLPNEYCLLTSTEQSSALGKYNAQTKRLDP